VTEIATNPGAVPAKSELRRKVMENVATMADSGATVKQGWIQTIVILLGIVVTTLLAYSKLDAKADTALDRASRAETKAERVESDMATAREELVKIRTVLEERLPRKGG